MNPGKLRGPCVPECFGERWSENPEELARHLGVWIACRPRLPPALRRHLWPQGTPECGVWGPALPRR